MHRLLRWLLSPDDYRRLFEDLDHERRARAAAEGADAARRWLHAQYRAAVWYVIRARLSSIRAASSRWTSDAVGDLRVALRRVLSRPLVTIATILTLGIGLGGAGAIVAVPGAALFGALPYEAPGRLVHLWETPLERGTRGPTSYPTLIDWRHRARSFSAIEGYDPANFTVGLHDGAHMRRGAQVTAGFFDVLGVPMSSGRTFTEHDVVDQTRVAIVSDRFAHGMSSDAAPGGLIVVNGVPHVVIGVLPHTFRFTLLQDADVFVPMDVAGQRGSDRLERAIHVVARLRDGVTTTVAQSELTGVMADLATEHTGALAGRTAEVTPLRDALLGAMKPLAISVVLAAVLLVIAAAANLTLLMASRGIERLAEVTTRTALGATRARLVRQAFVESLVPGAAGAAVAMTAGRWGTGALIGAIPDDVRISVPYLVNATLDVNLAAVIAMLALVMTAAASLAPMLLLMRSRAESAQVRVVTASRASRRMRRGLVAAQVAVTMTLLVAASLLVTSLDRLSRRDLGFHDPASLVTARAPLTGPRYDTPAVQQRFYETLIARGAAIPGVRFAALVDEVPGGGGGFTVVEPVNRLASTTGPLRVMLRTIGGDYFRTMGIPMIAGRAFDTRDHTASRPVAIVSARLASLLAGADTPLGMVVRTARTGDIAWEIVGVAGDVQTAALDVTAPPVIYVSHLHAAENRLTLVLRTPLDTGTAAQHLRTIVRDLDPDVPVYAVTRLDRQLDASAAVFRRRLPMTLIGGFALVALGLTVVGLHAVNAHDVSTRRREFAIRFALGATSSTVRRSIVVGAVRLTMLGVAIGTPCALAAAYSMRALLFGVTSLDWRVYAVVVAGLVGLSLVLALTSGRRAARLNPVVLLRE